MTKFSLFVCLICTFSFVACTGRQSTSTTPEGQPETESASGAVTREDLSSGPSSDLCTDDACPGVVR